MDKIEGVDGVPKKSGSHKGQASREALQMKNESLRAAMRLTLLKQQKEGRSVDGGGVSGGDDGNDAMGSELPDRGRRKPRQQDESEPEEDDEETTYDLVEAMFEHLSPPQNEEPDSDAEPQTSERPAPQTPPPTPVAVVETPAPVKKEPIPQPVANAPVTPPLAPVGPAREVALSHRVPTAPPLPPVVRREPTTDVLYITLPEEIDNLLTDLIAGPKGTPQMVRVRLALARFGKRLLMQCRMFDIRVVLTRELPSNMVQTLQGNRQFDNVAFAYFAAEKLCYVNLDRMDDGDEFGDGVVLTFASAIDHSMGEDSFASRQSPAVQSGVRACRNDEAGHTFIDGYCASSAQAYFAQGVAAWMTQPEGALRTDLDTGAYVSRSLLYDLDRGLYTYLQYLLKDARSYGMM